LLAKVSIRIECISYSSFAEYFFLSEQDEIINAIIFPSFQGHVQLSELSKKVKPHHSQPRTSYPRTVGVMNDPTASNLHQTVDKSVQNSSQTTASVSNSPAASTPPEQQAVTSAHTTPTSTFSTNQQTHTSTSTPLTDQIGSGPHNLTSAGSAITNLGPTPTTPTTITTTTPTAPHSAPLPHPSSQNVGQTLVRYSIGGEVPRMVPPAVLQGMKRKRGRPKGSRTKSRSEGSPEGMDASDSKQHQQKLPRLTMPQQQFGSPANRMTSQPLSLATRAPNPSTSPVHSLSSQSASVASGIQQLQAAASPRPQQLVGRPSSDVSSTAAPRIRVKMHVMQHKGEEWALVHEQIDVLIQPRLKTSNSSIGASSSGAPAIVSQSPSTPLPTQQQNAISSLTGLNLSFNTPTPYWSPQTSSSSSSTITPQLAGFSTPQKAGPGTDVASSPSTPTHAAPSRLSSSSSFSSLSKPSALVLPSQNSSAHQSLVCSLRFLFLQWHACF
jgi:hypothetical protein